MADDRGACRCLTEGCSCAGEAHPASEGCARPCRKGGLKGRAA